MENKKKNKNFFCFCFRHVSSLFTIWFVCCYLIETSKSKVNEKNSYNGVLVLYRGKLSEAYENLMINKAENLKNATDESITDKAVLHHYRDAYLFVQNEKMYELAVFPYKIPSVIKGSLTDLEAETESNEEKAAAVEKKEKLNYNYGKSNSKVMINQDVLCNNLMVNYNKKNQIELSLVSQEQEFDFNNSTLLIEDGNYDDFWREIVETKKKWVEVENISATATMKSDTIHVKIFKNLSVYTVPPKYTLYIGNDKSIKKWVVEFEALNSEVNIVYIQNKDFFFTKNEQSLPAFLSMDELPCLTNYDMEKCACGTDQIKYYLLKDILIDKYVLGRRFSDIQINTKYLNPSFIWYDEIDYFVLKDAEIHHGYFHTDDPNVLAVFCINGHPIFEKICDIKSFYAYIKNERTYSKTRDTSIMQSLLNLKANFLYEDWLSGQFHYEFNRSKPVSIISLKVFNDDKLEDEKEKLYELVLKIDDSPTFFKVLTKFNI